MLDARSTDEVESLISTAGAGRSAHVFLGTAAGKGSSIEYTGSQMWRQDSEVEPLLHTNHFLNGGQAAAELAEGFGTDNSAARYERSVEIVEQHGVDSQDAIVAFLDDAENSDFPICRPWAESPTLPGVDSGTVCAITMRLADSEMDVRLGPDPTGSWQTHAV